MSKILLTGMTAPQASSKANARSMSFAGLIYKALSQGNDVTWEDPDISATKADLDQYDSIIVGVSPITGLSATRTYGALNIIEHMYASPKLRLFIDAPNPVQITHSLVSVINKPESLVKDFFNNRQGYTQAREPETFNRLYSAVYWLATARWPQTFYPRLPWHQEDPIDVLPAGAKDYTTAINLDALALEIPSIGELPLHEKWVTDDTKSEWSQSVANTLEYPVLPTKVNRFSTDETVDVAMGTALGVILTPSKKRHTWWSYRYPQALRMHVPIVTEWRESRTLGDAWSVLASQVEHMSDDRRIALAEQQYQTYINEIPPVDEATKALVTYLGLGDTNA